MAALQKDDWNSQGERRRIERLALYEWSSGRFNLITLPELQRFRHVQYAPDGRSVVMVRYRRDANSTTGAYDIVSMNLRDFAITPVVLGLQDAQSPRLSPDGKLLAFGTLSVPQIELRPVAGGVTRSLLPQQNRRYGLNLVGFRSATEVLFTLLRSDGPLADEAAKLGYSRYEEATFSVAFTQDSVSQPRIVRPQPDDRWAGAEPSGLSMSQDGTVFAWTGRTEEGPNGAYRYDAFERRNGAVRRLTDLNTYTYRCAMSGDASTVAFAESPGRTLEFDLTVVETQTRRVTRTGLLERVRRIPPAGGAVRAVERT